MEAPEDVSRQRLEQDTQGAEAVLVFDGQCGFCTRSVEWLMPRVDRPVRYEPYQTADLGRYGLTEAQTARAVWWVAPTGRVHGGAKAVGQALLAVGGPWKLLGWLALLPPTSWLASLVYVLVSRNRRHLPGTTPACRRPHWNPRPHR
jgi:predicted DCC family thiol-disulfide oxidoreductase YuxK